MCRSITFFQVDSEICIFDFSDIYQSLLTLKNNNFQ